MSLQMFCSGSVLTVSQKVKVPVTTCDTWRFCFVRLFHFYFVRRSCQKINLRKDVIFFYYFCLSHLMAYSVSAVFLIGLLYLRFTFIFKQAQSNFLDVMTSLEEKLHPMISIIGHVASASSGRH